MRENSVRYERWAPLYERIRVDLGFDWERERASADVLRRVRTGSSTFTAWEAVERRLRGREAVVVGLGPGAGPPPLWEAGPAARRPALVAADGAAAVCLEAGLVPDVVVTDLDGPVPSEVTAQARGAALVVHAHGDNRAALERWLPEFDPVPLGTWAGPPEPSLMDLGGFTDGDRAAYLAEAAGAERVLLWGFDFDRVDPSEPRPSQKQAKLRWAEESLALLAAESPGRLVLWHRDGGREPFERRGDRRPTATSSDR